MAVLLIMILTCTLWHFANYRELSWFIISIITHRDFFFPCEKSFIDRGVMMPVSCLSIAQSGICKIWEKSSYFRGKRRLVFWHSVNIHVFLKLYFFLVCDYRKRSRPQCCLPVIFHASLYWQRTKWHENI